MKIVNPKSGEVVATAVHNLIEFSVGGTRIVVAGGDYVATIQYPDVSDKCLITVADGKMEIEQPEYQVEEPKEVQNAEEKNNPDETKRGEPTGEPSGGGDSGSSADGGESGSPSVGDGGGTVEDGKDGGNGEVEQGSGSNGTDGEADKNVGDRKFTEIR